MPVSALLLATCCGPKAPPAPVPRPMKCEDPIPLGIGAAPCTFSTIETTVDVNPVGWEIPSPGPGVVERNVRVGTISSPQAFGNGASRTTVIWSATERDSGIAFHLPVPLVPVPGTDPTILWKRRFDFSQCTDNTGHAVGTLTNEFRDSKGQLLAFIGILPTRADGGVLLPSDVATQFSVAWWDTGCAPRADGVQAGGLSVTLDGGPPVLVPVGQRLATVVDGTKYCVMVSRAYRASGDVCQDSTVVIYREDFFQRLDP